jgi:hypothetical protein
VAVQFLQIAYTRVNGCHRWILFFLNQLGRDIQNIPTVSSQNIFRLSSDTGLTECAQPPDQQGVVSWSMQMTEKRQRVRMCR